MVKSIFKRSFAALGRNPFLLMGLFGLTLLIRFLSLSLCGPFFLASFAIALVLNMGMANVFLAGYKKEPLASERLFIGFHSFLNTAAAMLWRWLWLLIWLLIPVAGIIMVLIKNYQYAFVPYLIAGDRPLSATAALKESGRLTSGYKSRMFGADCLILLIGTALLILSVALLFSKNAFLVLLGGFLLIVGLFLLRFLKGIIFAGFYEEITNAKANHADERTETGEPDSDSEI